MGMVEAVEITGKTLDNVLYQDAVLDAAKQVQQGVALSVPLKASGLFPPMIMHMLSIGEETGNLEEMLNNSAEYNHKYTQYHFHFNSPPSVLPLPFCHIP